ncbi:MAG: glycoside hydrolase family 18 protein [bacterium]|nr:glycoside hydrolase family 18 protein [bacterium]
MWLRLSSLLTLLCVTNLYAERIVGYYPNWAIYARNYLVTDIPAQHLTHINYAFATISNGVIALSDWYADIDRFYPGDCWDPGCERGNFHQLEILKQQHPHLQTLISVGGWSYSDYFSDVCLTAQSRETFASSCVVFMVEYGFDGVDIDWEYPDGGGEPGNIERPEDAANYVLLCDLLRVKLDSLESVYNREFLLTMAASATEEHIQNLDWSGLMNALDFVNVMCYDFSGAWAEYTYFNAPLYMDAANPFAEPVHSTFNSDNAMQAFLQEGVPRDKLVLGIPFYGKGFANVNTANNGLYQSFSGVSPHGTWENGFYDYWDVIENYEDQNGFTRYYNAISRVSYLFNPATHVFITYDDTVSIREKCDYVLSENFGGAMFWELAADRDGVLLETVYDTFTNAPDMPAPQALTVARIGDSLSFRWQGVNGAASYTLWSSADPLAPPWAFTLELTTPTTAVTLPVGASPMRAYFVRAQ